jgi:hypothetical protein
MKIYSTIMLLVSVFLAIMLGSSLFLGTGSSTVFSHSMLLLLFVFQTYRYARILIKGVLNENL